MCRRGRRPTGLEKHSAACNSLLQLWLQAITTMHEAHRVNNMHHTSTQADFRSNLPWVGGADTCRYGDWADDPQLAERMWGFLCRQQQLHGYWQFLELIGPLQEIVKRYSIRAKTAWVWRCPYKEKCCTNQSKYSQHACNVLLAICTY